MAERNRHHFDRFQIAEIGTVFFPGRSEVEKSQERHLGLLAAQAGKKLDTAVWDRLRGAIDAWGLNLLNESPRFATAQGTARSTSRRHLHELDGGTVGISNIDDPLPCVGPGL